ncbi:MAG: 4-hydroxybenzoate 3-monooxygenase [Alphaproteobacteria bacterium]|nr:4-hydroxybenzoate 3-monooxygenase [Alphaproteobacteria bacterium]MCY4319127.1 4-hydroxybenzoate 3-monooxygenase [Alphaproteobacteria bacterium]
MKRTQIGIVGAGPAGLMLSHLLARAGIDSTVLERRSRSWIEARVRAGLLEHGSVDLLERTGLGTRMAALALRHRGIEISSGGQRHHIDFTEMTGGRGVTVYAQHEVVKDLATARLGAGGDVRFEMEGVRLEDIEGPEPRLVWPGGTLACDFIVGCDGYHGVSRASIPPSALTLFHREFSYAWLGLLAEAPPFQDELIYARHEAGFALFSMRSPALTRAYVQCRAGEDPENWPAEMLWDELDRRLGVRLNRGPLLLKSVTPMRAFVAEPMRYGRLFLAGDAAHIVPPTGAKGMNLAFADVVVLARALARYYRDGDEAGLDAYSETCLARVWKVQRFSMWMTRLLHRDPAHDEFEQRLQGAELDYVLDSHAAQRMLAENYTGLPLDLEGV